MKICRRQTAQCPNKKDKKGKGRYDEKRMTAGIILILMMAFCLPVTAKAASGSLQLSALSETVSKGSQVTVVCQVASAESFADVSFRLSYDDSILTFLSGGKR